MTRASVWGGFGAAVRRGGLLARLGPGWRNVGCCVATTGQLSRRSRKPATGKYRGRAWKEGMADATG